ncbi:MAG TPA: ArsR family transcriptional regulator [Aldersonia sp.]
MNTQDATVESEPGQGGEPITPQETRAAALGLTVRGYMVVRQVFVQNYDAPRPSTLGEMTRKRRHRALVLYLLVLCWWPWLNTNYHPLTADVWISGLTATGPNKRRALTWSPSTLSRAWKDLEDLGLIEKRERDGRLTTITPRREDGKAAYVAPSGEKKDWLNTYFTIPDEFWTEEYFGTLNLPALAVLLIILKETTKKPDTPLRRTSMPEWYGISGKTVQKGLDELNAVGLLHERVEVVRAPLSPNGITRHYHYSLTGAFGRESRRARQRVANRKRRNRAKKKAARAAASPTS